MTRGSSPNEARDVGGATARDVRPSLLKTGVPEPALRNAAVVLRHAAGCKLGNAKAAEVLLAAGDKIALPAGQTVIRHRCGRA